MKQNDSELLFYQTDRKLNLMHHTEGIRIWDQSGKEYIDGSSGAVVCNIGYGNERINAAIIRQAQSSFFAYRLHFENKPALKLAKSLVKHTAPHLNRVFYVSGGSEAVETSIKLCRHYFFSIGEGSRHIFISRRPSYHGCTLGALALTSYAPLEIPFRPLIRSYPKIPAPYCYRCEFQASHPECGLQCAWELEKTIKEQGPENVAAFIAEPIGGASTGALVPPDGYFDVIQKICRKFGIMLILDEVMTGFGRTGKLFGYEHWGIQADIIALSKGMAAGYYPLGAVMTGSSIVDALMHKSGFAHGFTYAGNPMACAVGLEAFNILLDDNLTTNSASMGHNLKSGLRELAARHAIIGQVRGKGLLLAIELVENYQTRQPFSAERNIAQQLTDIAYEEGLILYPRRSMNGIAGDHVLVAPPLILTPSDVEEILARLARSMERLEKGL